MKLNEFLEGCFIPPKNIVLMIRDNKEHIPCNGSMANQIKYRKYEVDFYCLSTKTDKSKDGYSVIIEPVIEIYIYEIKEV